MRASGNPSDLIAASDAAIASSIGRLVRKHFTARVVTDLSKTVRQVRPRHNGSGGKMASCLVSRVAGFALLYPSLLVGQASQQLAPANGRLTDSVGTQRTISELPDGRVLLSQGAITIVGDFGSGNVTPLSNVPTGLYFKVAGDTTIVVTPRIGWVYVHGTDPVGALPPDNLVVARLRPAFAMDTLNFGVSLAMRDSHDSVDVILVARKDGSSARIVTLLSQGVPGGVPAPVYLPREVQTLTPDGWLAVVRVNPYRVDWRSPSGSWTRGDSIAVPLIPMTEREKVAMMARNAFGPTPEPTSSIAKWPATVVPINSPQVFATPSHTVLVLREPNADHPNSLYDEIDRSGHRLRSIELGAGERILGFGLHSVYVLAGTGRKKVLSRHPWQ
ncbi:MAG TPA: hypothetical protein VGM77_06260 [Gemmatimonadales bacterium]